MVRSTRRWDLLLRRSSCKSAVRCAFNISGHDDELRHGGFGTSVNIAKTEA